MTDLKVWVQSSHKTYGLGESIDLSVSVENLSTQRLFVVTARPLHHYGPPYVWKINNSTIGVKLAEEGIPPGFCYYEYVPPALLSLPPRKTRMIPVSVGMPPRAGRLEKGAYVWVETPVSGRITIELTVGYLKDRLKPNGTWAEFVRFQETVSKRLIVHIK